MSVSIGNNWNSHTLIVGMEVRLTTFKPVEQYLLQLNVPIGSTLNNILNRNVYNTFKYIHLYC